LSFFLKETLYPWEAREFKRDTVALQMRGSVALHRNVINILKKGGLWVVPT
jgi:hypothetical protein